MFLCLLQKLEYQSLSKRSSVAYLCSSTLECITALRVHLRSIVPHSRASAQQTDTRAHSAFTLDRTSLSIEHTIRLPKSCTHTLDCTLPALERISAIGSNRLERAKHYIFLKNFFLLIYIFVIYIYLFIFAVFFLSYFVCVFLYFL